MFSFKRGIEAGRYWASILKTQRRDAETVDSAALLQNMRSIYTGIDDTLAALRKDGVAAIENYWSPSQCAAARTEIDRLIVDFPDSVRCFSADSDRRMFGVEMCSETLRAFHDDALLRSVGEFVGGRKLFNFATLGARIDATGENRGSGDGWHRDAFGYQFKAILYLNDVTTENGPFEYAIGSHRQTRAILDAARGRVPVPPESRIDLGKMQHLLDSGALESRVFPARAGTVLLAITSGVHRGVPLKAGHRYALTNYYYNKFQIGETMLKKFQPMMPGAAERIRSATGLTQREHRDA